MSSRIFIGFLPELLRGECLHSLNIHVGSAVGYPLFDEHKVASANVGASRGHLSEAIHGALKNLDKEGFVRLSGLDRLLLVYWPVHKLVSGKIPEASFPRVAWFAVPVSKAIQYCAHLRDSDFHIALA
ncbi:hypothetical protein ABIB99_008889 [Bradyrhizobium sp. LA6.1]|uniref:hypothetical protein n=1 Tax=Bradyrhizobium sp. LA6.1 TaxID=3156378 RepID=UPI003395FABE